VRTGAGALDARYVYHAVVIDYELQKGTAAIDVAEVVRNVVGMAVADGVRSVALPLFGAGVGGLSVEISLATILEALETAAAGVPSPLSVEIVVRDVEEFQQAAAVFQEYEGREARQAEEDRLAEEAVRKLLEG
jgi:O-acetyl-ADP-ribose deacetylase (regulator of RNase III)